MEQNYENQLYIDDLVNHYKISDSTLKLFSAEINDFVNHHFKCNPKTSFKNCQQIIPGYEQVLVYENGQFYQKLVPCAHLVKQQEEQKFLDNFYFADFDPMETKNFMFFNTVKAQRDFYLLDPNENWSQISEFIKDKNEFKIKSNLMKNFLNQIGSKANDWKGVYLEGTMGVGKTSLLKFFALIAASRYQKTVAFSSVNTLINHLKKGFDDGDKVNGFLTGLQEVDFLVLDDLGSEQVTKWVRDDVLFTLLNYRMENHKLTYFTSNFSLSELEKHYLAVSDRDPNNKIKTNRLMERIKTLTTETLLKGQDHRY